MTRLILAFILCALFGLAVNYLLGIMVIKFLEVMMAIMG